MSETLVDSLQLAIQAALDLYENEDRPDGKGMLRAEFIAHAIMPVFNHIGSQCAESLALNVRLENENTSLRSSLAAANEAKAKAEAALCRARSATAVMKSKCLYCHGTNTGWDGKRCVVCDNMDAALSSTAPCPHEARVKALEEAVEWALSDSYRDALREYGLALEAGCDPNGAWSSVRHELGKWRDEIRRRAGRGE